MVSSLHINTTTTQSRPKGATPSSPLVASSYKAAKMSITQTYFLAHKARGKLSSEAARPDHNLRLLVGHANLLDSLMLELADAEREQESWFNQSVRGATKSSQSEQEPKHIQWADSIVEEPEHDWHAEDADSYSDSDSSDSDSDLDEDEDIEMADIVSLRRIPSNSNIYYDDMEEDDDEEEDYAQLSLQRTTSHSASPPELDHDSDSSEDETMPPSPPTAVLPTFSKEGKEAHITTTSLFTAASTEEEADKDAFYEQGYYLPPRNPARLVSAISVY
ncbi:hypothetical protein B0H66DRAFT_203765 [Apodospora peruviana]|uniref:Protein ECM13 n=1 Tax=Apodospora peruviana TaxID=516989 RepID=A0AAE0ICX9_9PEZI|nr:hypothetical protein B0H66DRAFT_203765 [Apodospora peruviana]